MITFKEFLSESMEERNKSIDLRGIIEKTVDEWSKKGRGSLSKEEVDVIFNYMRDKKVFSIEKMDDKIGTSTITWGLLKQIVDDVKSVIDSKGWGRRGGASEKISRAQAIDGFLKQKQVSRR